MEAGQCKTRQSSLMSSRKIVSHEHLNANGTLFGGYLMCWIDEVAFMCARRFSGQLACVTASIDNITFKTPLRVGEHVILSSVVNAVGKSSMQIEVTVERENPVNTERTFTHSAHLTFVALDENSKPVVVPRLQLESAADHLKQHEAMLRAKVRQRLDTFLARRLESLRIDTLQLSHQAPAPLRRLGSILRQSKTRWLSVKDRALSQWLDRLEDALSPAD